jgi:homoisocitrate dehydrogenase
MPKICLIPGDGIGQEVVPVAARLLAALAPDLEFSTAEAGWDCFRRCGTALPEATLAAVAGADAALFGATQSPSGPVPGYASPILELRRHFDLYANLRPAVSLLPGGPRLSLLIVRENTEGLYSGRERREGDMAIAERVITRRASERIARTAFDQARQRGRARQAGFALAEGKMPAAPSVTIVHKANVLKLTDGLFRECCLEVAREYPDVETREMLVDAAAMWLAKEPSRFDVIVTTNLFGDILSDLAAGLIGGLGLAPSANLGDGRVAVFEPVHGSAPDIAGQGIADPAGAILSGALLLEHLGRTGAARRLWAAVAAVLISGPLPRDLGGSARTDEIAEAILEQVTWI